MMNKSVHQKDITILIVYVSTKKVSKYKKQNRQKWKETKMIQELKILTTGMELSNPSLLLQYTQHIPCILAIIVFIFTERNQPIKKKHG